MKILAGATIFAIALTMATTAHASSTATMRAMDKVEHSDYSMDASIANNLYIVPDYIALHRPEVKYLEVHAKEAVPSILARLKSTKPLHGEYTQAIYLRVLQLSQDSRALPVVADYFDSIPENWTPDVTPSFLIATRIAKHWLHHDPIFAADNEDANQIFRQRHHVAQMLRGVKA